MPRSVPIRDDVSDVLHLDGRSTLDLPYAKRRALPAGLPLGGTVGALLLGIYDDAGVFSTPAGWHGGSPTRWCGTCRS